MPNMATHLTDSLVEGLADQFIASAGIALGRRLADTVEVTLPGAYIRKVLLVLNTDEATVEITLLPEGIDLLRGKAVDGCLSLGPHGCAVLNRRCGSRLLIASLGPTPQNEGHQIIPSHPAAVSDDAQPALANRSGKDTKFLQPVFQFRAGQAKLAGGS